MTVPVNGDRISLKQLWQFTQMGNAYELTTGARDRMNASRAVVERALESDKPTYGVNTGFGKLSDVQIPHDRLSDLQVNLVRSHACGFGEPLTDLEARGVALLRANVLARGFSGARPRTAEIILEVLSKNAVPHIPSRGSVGASGDLAPLAHLAMVLIGEGRARFAGESVTAADLLENLVVSKLELQAKEGLALLNGTQAITSVGGLALYSMERLIKANTAACALSLEGLLGTPTAFDERIHEGRGQSGQIRIAAALRNLTDDSAIRESHREGDTRVQDAYCLRCAPQVHGAVLDCFEFAAELIERETCAATDNPLVFAESGDILSGGNFHGAPAALALDAAAIGIVQLMSISERRIDRLVNPDSNEGLPAFLAESPGLESGFMIAHVAAAAALNEARILAHPASVDNTPTSGGKEDHVSMGMTSALKLRSLVQLLAQVTAIELVCAAQGVIDRKPLTPARALQPWIERIQSYFPPLTADRFMGEEIESLAKALIDGSFDDLCESVSL